MGLLQMQQIAPRLRKTSKIAKHKRLAPAGTPTKRTVIPQDQIATLKKPAALRPIHLISQQVYQLDYLNSLIYSEGKILNLLSPAQDRPRNQRKIKCKCSKSRCESKYCECFAKGRICGPDCECINCNNLSPSKHWEKVVVEKGCKCSKSHCMKNYCQCFQKGEPCTDKCSCVGCKNGKN